MQRKKPLSAIRKALLLGAAIASLGSAAAGPQVRVPLYLYWNDIDDNLTSIRTTAGGYRQVRVEARVLKDTWPGAVPIKMYYHPQRNDSFITATPESEQAAIGAGYKLVKEEGYLFQGPIPGTVPLKLYWHSGRQDFATVASAQGQIDQERSGYSFVRVEGYVFAANDPDFGANRLELQTYADPKVAKTETAFKTSFVVHQDLAGSGCRYSWMGTIFGDHPHDVVLTICDTGVVGRVEIGGKVYEIDPKRMTKAAVFNNQTPPSQPTPVHGKNIDMAIGYTTRVLEKYRTRLNVLASPMTPGAYARAYNQLAVDHLNAVFGASGIPANMRLVRSHLFSNIYEESFSSVSDALKRIAPRGLSWCDGGDDPYNAKEIRNRTGADLLSLWVDDSIRGDNSGVGYYSENRYYCDQVNAFSVVKAGAALIQSLTFAHEIGHNLGAGHAAGEPQDDDYLYEPVYAHGHTDRIGGFRTIMAYGTACGEDKETLCPRVPYFSSPRVKIDPAFKSWSLTGRPAGASTANNALRITQESGPVSAYRSLGCTGSGFGCPSGGPGGGGSDGGGDEGGPVVKN